MKKYWHKNKSAFLYSKELTKEYSRSFYAASLLLPRHRRWGTFAIYGFCRYVDNMIDKPRARNIDEIRTEMEDLRTELKIAYRTTESEHPVLSPFIITAAEFNIPIEYPLELVTGVLMDLENKSYQTFQDLYQFCYRVAAVVGLMMTHVLGYYEKAAFQYAEKLGIAFQLTNILRDIQEDKEMGRIYVPRQEMDRFGVRPEDFFNENFTAAFKDLIKYQISRAQEYYRQSHPGIAMLEQSSRFSIYSAKYIYGGILNKIEKNDYNPFLGRVYVPFSSKAAIILTQIIRTKLLRRV